MGDSGPRVDAHRVRWAYRAVAVTATALVALLVALLPAGSASAEGLGADNAFAFSGARVFDDSAVGIDCTVFGSCTGATFFELNGGTGNGAVTRYQGSINEGVEPLCQVNDLVRVRVFPADIGIVTGWVSLGSLKRTRDFGSCRAGGLLSAVS